MDMDNVERLRCMDEMQAFLRAGAAALGLAPTQVLRFSGLFQIANTGVDVAWDDTGGPDGEPVWVLRHTYSEVQLSGEDCCTVTEDVVCCGHEQTGLMAHAAMVTVAEKLLDGAMDKVELPE